MALFAQYKKEWDKSPRIYAASGGLLVIVLAAYLHGAWWWVEERMFHFDAAFYLFRLIYMDEFQLFHDRYINLVTQWLPLACYRAGGDLLDVARSYSFALPIVQLALIGLLFHWRKHPFVPLLFAFVLFAPLRFRYFSPVSETHFVLIFASLYFFLSQHAGGWKDWSRWATLACIPLAGISHPVAVLPMAGMLAVSWVTRPVEETGFRWIESGLLFMTFGWRYWLAMKNPYEATKLSVLEDPGAIISRLQNSEELALMGDYFFDWHLGGWLVFMVMLVALTRNGSYRLTGVLLVFAALLVMMVAVTFSYLDFPVYHMLEGYLGFVSLVWMVPIYILWRNEMRRGWIIFLMGMVMLCSALSILEARTYYQERAAYLREVYEPWQHQGNKWLMMSRDAFPWHQLWYPWAVPFETLLLSGVRDPGSAVTLYIPDDNAEMEQMTALRDTLLGAWKAYPVDHLDPRLFQLPRQPYLDITGAGLPRGSGE